ncbi:MAG: hypothetical protein H0W11_06525 [Gemmatimonadetes bacterium]|nr:hypothetical protein [Gemmatimonadota bacterium]MBA4159989.1 hypothetical protein [Gemmatimonadota bacterium]
MKQAKNWRAIADNALDEYRAGTIEGYSPFCNLKQAIETGGIELNADETEDLLDVLRTYNYRGRDYSQADHCRMMRLWLGHILVINRTTPASILRQLLREVGGELPEVVRKIGRQPCAGRDLQEAASELLSGRKQIAFEAARPLRHPPCPYCRRELDRTPRQQAKCPHCGETYRVRKTQMLFYPRVVLTRDEAIACDLFVYLQSQKGPRGLISERDYHDTRENLALRLGYEPTPKVVLCALMETIYRIAPQVNNLQIGENFRFFLHHEDNDAISLLREVRRAELLAFQHDRVKKVQIFTEADACQTCRSHRGCLLTIEAALRDQPLPHQSCSNWSRNTEPGFCQCRYVPPPKT